MDIGPGSVQAEPGGAGGSHPSVHRQAMTCVVGQGLFGAQGCRLNTSSFPLRFHPWSRGGAEHEPGLGSFAAWDLAISSPSLWWCLFLFLQENEYCACAFAT